MGKPRVMYIVKDFPQMSQIYILSEIEAISAECDVRVISMKERPNIAVKRHPPFEHISDPERIVEQIRSFQPHVLHTHWLQKARELAFFAGYFSRDSSHPITPFTIRAHSFDVLESDAYIRESMPLINSDLCLGVLAFPFARPALERGGVRSDKIFDCFPVVNYGRFHDRSPNGDAVMNIGACLPKKQMEDFLHLAAAVPSKEFNLYALAYLSHDIERLNEQMGSPVRIVPPVEPEDMPQEYKRHEWLVYTASRTLGTVGWPMAVAEAQAAGVGVCFPNIRPDLRDYVGPAGYLYDSIEEVADIITKPYPAEMREAGFAHARKSDVFEHKRILLDLWRQAAGSARPEFSRRMADGDVDWGDGETPLEEQYRHAMAADDLARVIPTGEPFLVAGDLDQWEAHKRVIGRRAMPFLQRDGQFWGDPADDSTAISELERMREQGVRFIAFGSPTFWWFDYYPQFNQHLRSHFTPVVENKQVAIFDMRG